MMLKLIFAGLLLAVPGCTASKQTVEKAPASNASAIASPSIAAKLSEPDVTAKEKQAWDALKNRDFDAFGLMLADDMIDVSSEGTSDKSQSIAGVKRATITDVSFADWKVTTLDPDALVVTYTATVKGSVAGQSMPSMTYRTSSGWANRDGKWLSIYHQETPLVPASPFKPDSRSATGPQDGATPTGTSTPSQPMAASSGTPDTVANEKQVWDALKRKDYTAFENLLAADALNVEPDGVHDKADTIKGLSGSDLSKASLSEFKEVKFDSNASLVTYVVKSPTAGFDPKGERHTTIWVSRGGKWLAVFHQGTPISTPPQHANSPASSR